MISIKKRFFLLLSVFAFSAITKAQSTIPDVIATDGGYDTSSVGSISYTIGEPISETFSTTNNILTQGFQQPTTVVVTSIPEISSDGNIFAYPNPVSADLILDFAKMNEGDYTIEIIDMVGKLISKSNLKINASVFIEKINLSNYDNGVYIFKITNTNNASIKSFRIIKQ